MAYMSFADLDPPATDAECNLWPTARLVWLARRRAASDARRAAGPMHALRALAYQTPGESVLFTQYVLGSQMSAILLNACADTGAEFSTHVERSLVDGSITGVRVTLKSRATRGRAPDVTRNVAK